MPEKNFMCDFIKLTNNTVNIKISIFMFFSDFKENCFDESLSVNAKKRKKERNNSCMMMRF